MQIRDSFHNGFTVRGKIVLRHCIRKHISVFELGQSSSLGTRPPPDFIR